MSKPEQKWQTNDWIRLAMAVLFIIAAAVLASGCTTAPTLQTVKVPVPVECREAEPARPVMPTDRLLPGATVDAFIQAAQAEIDRREGYELKLVTALRACIAPITPTAQ